jgi:hypothetical protein
MWQPKYLSGYQSSKYFSVAVVPSKMYAGILVEFKYL